MAMILRAVLPALGAGLMGGTTGWLWGVFAAGVPHLPQNALFAPSGEPQVLQKLAICLSNLYLG